MPPEEGKGEFIDLFLTRNLKKNWGDRKKELDSWLCSSSKREIAKLNRNQTHVASMGKKSNSW